MSNTPDRGVARRRTRRTSAQDPSGINSHARDLSLQIALLVSVLASLIGLVDSFRMMRRRTSSPSPSVEGTAVG